jgi:hypothetical protein
MRPYDLRHAYVSLMIQAGHTVVEVAKWAGHSPQVCLSTYAPLFDTAGRAGRSRPRDSRGALTVLARTSSGPPDDPVCIGCARDSAGAMNGRGLRESERPDLQAVWRYAGS